MEATIVSTFTQNKSLEQPSHGDYVDTWEIPVNLDWSEIDTAFGGSSLLNSTGLSGDTALTATQYRPLSLLISGTPTGTITYVVPSGVGGQWVFLNGTAGGQTVGIKSGAGGSTITVAAGLSVIVSCDGSSSGMRKSITEPAIAAGATGQIQYYASGVLGATGGLTWTTASATSPTGALGVTGTVSVSGPISASGTITSTTGGFVFPDGTTQITAIGAGHVSAAAGTFSNTVGVDNLITNYSALSGNTGSWFNLTTGRYTPPAGRYFIMCCMSIQAPASGNGTAMLGIRKNGVALAGIGSLGSGATLFSIPITVGVYVDANGTDIFDFFVNPLAAGMSSQGNAAFTAYPI